MAHDHDIFLSHSYADTDNAKQIVKAWKKFGYAVYADFLDDKLLEASKKKEMTAELSEHLRSKIKTSRVFVFLASSHAAGSGWMPWELGLAHGAVGRVHPCYLDDASAADFQAREYMKLYEKTSFRLEDAETYLKTVVDKARQEALDPPILDFAKIFGGDLAKGLLEKNGAEMTKKVEALLQLQQQTQCGAADETTNRSKKPGGSTTTEP